MASYYDEGHWFGWAGWKQLSSGIVKEATGRIAQIELAVRESDGALIEAGITAFVDDLIAGIAAKAELTHRALNEKDARGAPSSMWLFAPTLLADRSRLIKALMSDIPALAGRKTVSSERGDPAASKTVTPEAALGQIIKTFVYQERIKQHAASEQRVKNWEAFDRHSMIIARESLDSRIAQRGSTEHLFALKDRMKELYPTNKNLNVSVGTLKTYFDEFYLSRTYGDYEDATEENWRALEDATGLWPDVDPCIDALKAKSPELWEAFETKVGLSDDRPPETAQSYMSRLKITRHAFEARCATAKKLIQDCVFGHMDFQSRRYR